MWTISSFLTPIITTLVTPAIAGSLSMVAVLVLLFLLIEKELASAARSEPFQRLGRMLNVAIAPLLIAFMLILIIKVVEVFK